MHPYSFAVTLRINHPSCDPDRFTTELGMTPNRSWKAGDKRITPKGTPLEGIYSDTYWYVWLTEEKINSKVMTLPDYLSSCLKKLERYEPLFNQVRAEGGRTMLYVFLYIKRNSGFELTHQQISDFAKLGISLGLDLYPE